MKTLIAVPCMDMVPVEFAASLMDLKKSEGCGYAFKANALIYDSRNSFVATAIDKGYDRILWLDSDMSFDPDTLLKLEADMDQGMDFVCGLCFKRHFPTSPVIYKRLEYHNEDAGNGKRRVKAEAETYTDYPRDQVFEIQGAGLGCAIVRTDVLKEVWDKYGPPFDPMTQIGEDLACCLRIRNLGVKMYCDSRVKLGHIGLLRYDEGLYLQQEAQHGQKV